MENHLRLGVIGTGNMAKAILDAVLAAEIFPPDHITVFDKVNEKLQYFLALDMKKADHLSDVVSNSDLILLSVKPQDFPDILSQIGDQTAGKCLLSIAAGITTEQILTSVAKGTYVVRVMPNTPLMVACGATVIAGSPKTPSMYFDVCFRMFAASGHVEILDESFLSPVISVNSSSPAYFYKMVEIMALYAEKQGIDKKVAVLLAAKAMEGAAKMILKRDKSPDELIQMVASPGGTTLAALNSLENNHFESVIQQAMEACTKRAKELAIEN